jgi:hypothetical protein
MRRFGSGNPTVQNCTSAAWRFPTPLFGGLQVHTPDGRVMTYPDAALVSMKFGPQPYSWPEKLKIAGICLAVLAVWLLIALPDLRWLWERLHRKRF